MTLERRSAIRLIASTLAVLSASRRSVLAELAGEGAEVAGELYFAACKSPETSRFGLGVIAESGAVSGWSRDVETRLHGGAVRPGSAELVAVARRPGRIAIVFDARDGSVVRTLPAADDRFYLGHAVFDEAGDLLFITEAETGSGAGLVGVYDAQHGYTRIGEWPTLGTDPHELLLAADGRSLWVANGGIELHPETGRAVLNEGPIVSTLVEIGLDGRPKRQIALPGDMATLSLRHIALAGKDGVVIGCQDQGRTDAALPVIWHADGNGRVRPLAEAANGWPALKGYIGSIAVDAWGRTVLATSPRGNRAIALSLDDSSRWSELSAIDVGGVAARGEPGRFLLTTGSGAALEVAVELDGALAVERSSTAPVQWDNHIIATRRTRTA